ncbi:MarR family winged helix-turn-helix transcriptional regulator [Neptuniibacter caesariensis]|uniref:Putative transcription regulator protein n=1 Tax=Neptuniibacter caesariensis TaxID=207954 RepID=A0A7U8GSQ0_NEPCE|nr:MarR family transcriptional regulator [Neptuniibacter caesariensis]EAR61315.1 putative transcription regulator protein [Oceanospirillum sp. MED92] [Neptuniibacter caesariensis]
MSSAPKNEIFTQVVLEVFKVGGLLNIDGDKLTKEFGLTASRWKILGAIMLSDNPVTVPEIGRYMGQSRQAVQRLVDVMAKDGLLTMTENPNHKRAKYIQMTTKAVDIYKQLDMKQVKWAEGLSSDLSTSEMESALKVLKHIAKQISA